MNIVCPYCASRQVKKVSDPGGDLGWCRQCHRTWLAGQTPPANTEATATPEADEWQLSAVGKDT
jgi:ribosomal protein L37AE/L43A